VGPRRRAQPGAPLSLRAAQGASDEDGVGGRWPDEPRRRLLQEGDDSSAA